MRTSAVQLATDGRPEALLLPIVLAPESVRVGLAAAGESRARRQALLAEAGLEPVLVERRSVLSSLHVLFVAGLDPESSADLAHQARREGILVNVEDMPELCDFHGPAIVRRGELVLTASTGGRAPGLARRLREWLEDHFGPEWNSRVDELGRSRDGWRTAGLSPHEVSERSRTLIAEKGWLQ